MLMPERRPIRPVSQTTIPAHEDTATMLDRLIKEGKISGGQAAQYKVWEAARPAATATQAQFRGWMSGRPNFPGLPPMEVPASAPVHRPVPPMARPVAPPARPAAPPQPTVLETLEKLFKEGRVTRAQLERYKKWEAERPAIDAGRGKFDAWTKSRPDIPHLEDYLKENVKTVVPPPPGARPDSMY